MVDVGEAAGSEKSAQRHGQCADGYGYALDPEEIQAVADTEVADGMLHKMQR